MTGPRKPEPDVIDRANRTPRGRWEIHDPADSIRPDGWLVWGGGTFAGAERIDDAIQAWRAAARKAWR